MERERFIAKLAVAFTLDLHFHCAHLSERISPFPIAPLSLSLAPTALKRSGREIASEREEEGERERAYTTTEPNGCQPFGSVVLVFHHSTVWSGLCLCLLCVCGQAKASTNVS